MVAQLAWQNTDWHFYLKYYSGIFKLQYRKSLSTGLLLDWFFQMTVKGIYYYLHFCVILRRQNQTFCNIFVETFEIFFWIQVPANQPLKVSITKLQQANSWNTVNHIFLQQHVKRSWYTNKQPQKHRWWIHLFITTCTL